MIKGENAGAAGNAAKEETAPAEEDTLKASKPALRKKGEADASLTVVELKGWVARNETLGAMLIALEFEPAGELNKTEANEDTDDD